jgi:hypothetical protein
MSDNRNFGQYKNGMQCNCGKHHGVGQWTAEDRAAVYASIRKQMPKILTDLQKYYLESWEAIHGKITYYEIWHDGKVDKSNKDIYGEANIGKPIRYRTYHLEGNYQQGNNQSRPISNWHE